RCVLADLPNPDAIVSAAREQTFPIRAEDHRIHLLQGLGERVAPLARPDIPKFHCSIRAGAGKNLAVRPECEAVNTAVMAGKGAQLAPFSHVPEFDLLIVAAGRQ